MKEAILRGLIWIEDSTGLDPFVILLGLAFLILMAIVLFFAALFYFGAGLPFDKALGLGVLMLAICGLLTPASGRHRR